MTTATPSVIIGVDLGGTALAGGLVDAALFLNERRCGRLD